MNSNREFPSHIFIIFTLEKIKKLLPLVFVLLLAFSLRFYQLGENPPHLNWDEAALGYNAYSILKTGRDEYGIKFPLYLRSFDDYKPPMYVYLTIPSVAIFGLNDWAVRLPSALLGTLTVAMMYFLVKEISDNSKLAILSMFFLAISPWHLQFSRVAFEANIALFFTVFGVWMFLKGIKKAKFLILSVIFCSFTLYSYHSPRVFIPLLGLGLAFLFRKKIFKAWKYCLLAVIMGMVICLPLVKIMASTEGQMRIRGTSIFAHPIKLLDQSSERTNKDRLQGFLLAGFFHNRRLAYFKTALDGYLLHFNLNWLFLKGDINRHHAPEVGLLYLWELPFVLAGIYFLIKKKPKFYQIIFLWLFLAPVPAAPTLQLPHAVRALNMVIPLHIFTASGVYMFLENIRERKSLIKNCLLSAACCLLFINFIYYLHQYYVHLPLDWSDDWQYGRKEMVLAAESLKDRYNEIIVSTELEKSYMFFLYYLKYNPQKYLSGGGTVSGGFAETGNQVDKYKFRPLNWEKERRGEDILLIGSPNDFPEGISAIKIIYNLSGEEVIRFVSF